MNSIQDILKTMRSYWLNEPATPRVPAFFWLSPEQRYTRLEELLYPVSRG